MAWRQCKSLADDTRAKAARITAVCRSNRQPAERVSHDLITPSAARAVFESILWEPGLRWRIRRIEVLKPVRWISARRNEVAAITSSRNALTAMK